MDDIRNIYELLQSDEEERVREGVQKADAVKNLSLLIMPPAPPAVWEVCAQILAKKPDEELEPHLIELLKWLNDLNWPGALTIYERLIVFSGEKLRDPLINCVVCIIREMEHGACDSRWVRWLAELLDNESLRHELPEDIAEFLQRYYRAWNKD